LEATQQSVSLGNFCFIFVHRLIALMSTHRGPHSAQVSMVLHLAGIDVRLSQMGPNFIILKEALAEAAPAQEASITLTVDDRVKQFPVDFPQGIPAGQRRIALPEAEPSLVGA
jgi:hypothetical protein